jgi:outer membrane protein assembly factor BamB
MAMQRRTFLGILTASLAAGCARQEPVAEVRPQGRRRPQAAPPPAAGDWPWWRGPTLDGKGEGQPPLRWSRNENVLWRTPIPGRGHASPVVGGGLVYLLTAEEKSQQIRLLAVDRNRGGVQWNTLLHEGGFIHRHEKNSHASATPAFDGRRVYCVAAVQDAVWVTAVDADGRIVWRQQAGPFASQHGYGSSPVIYGELVIVAADQDGPGYLAAFDRARGRLVWRVRRYESPSYATPIVLRVAGRDQLLLAGCAKTAAYDPATGELLWYCEGPSQVAACTMCAQGDLVVSSGGYPEKRLLCIRADGRGDVSASHVVWSTDQAVTYVPSPLIHDGLLFVVNDGGVAACWSLEDGKSRWRQRLGGNFSASPVLAGGHIYAADETGTTYVFKALGTYDEVAQNVLPEGQFATLAVCGRELYLRTTEAVYAIGHAPAT